MQEPKCQPFGGFGLSRIAISLAVLASLLAISVIVAGATSNTTDDPFTMEAEAYAEDFGTTLEEAIRRLKLQTTIGELDQQLTSNESETFAGLWIQHEPTFAALARFTRDGENTIQPYISGGDLEDPSSGRNCGEYSDLPRGSPGAAAEKVNSVTVRINSGSTCPKTKWKS